MRRKILLINILLILISWVGFSQEPSKNDPLKGLTVVKISPKDETAVIKTPEGRMEVIRVGGSIGNSATVTEIAKDMIVVEERTERGMETVIIRFEGKNQTVRRVKKLGDSQPRLSLPKQVNVDDDTPKTLQQGGP